LIENEQTRTNEMRNHT